MKAVASFLESRWMPPVLLLSFAALLALISLGIPTHNDEGVWLYMGKMWAQKGLLPYVDTLDNKPPGIYYVYALASLFPGIGYVAGRVLAMAASVSAAAIVLGGLSRYHSRQAGAIGAACFSLASCWQYTQGALVHVTETYVVLFVVAAWYFALKARNRHQQSGSVWPWLVCSGAALAAAINFKQVALTSFAALALIIVLYGVTKRDWRGMLCALAAYGAGLILAFLAVLLPLLLSGVSLHVYWEGAWLILLQPGMKSDASLTHQIYTGLVKWTSPEMRLFLPFLLFLVCRAVRDPEKRFVAAALLIWIAFDFLGVNASGRYLENHFKQILPSLCIMAGYSAAELLRLTFHEEEQHRQAFAALVLTIVLLFFPANATLNGLSHVFFQKADRAQEIGQWVREHSTEDDYVQMAGGAITQVLPFTERQAPGRLFHHCLFSLLGAQREFLRDVERHPPRYVIFDREPDEERPPWLTEWVQRYYRPVHEDFGIAVCERTTGEVGSQQ